MIKYYIAILSLILTTNLFAQKDSEILAKIGDKIITAKDFQYRYEFTPQVNRKYNDKGKAKEELLYTLIAEYLFALEAEELGYDTLNAMQTSYIPLEKMHVRDALYKEEISNKVKFDKGKFIKGLKLASHKLFVDYVYSKDKQAIDNAYKLLTSNSNFDSLVTLIKDAEYVSKPYEVEYGKMYPTVEEVIFNLSINEFTAPIESPDGYYIFRLISKFPIKYKTYDQKSSKVKKVVEGRIEDSVYNDYWKNFFSNLRVTTDGPLFWYFAEEMQKLIAEVKIEQKIEDNAKINLTGVQLNKFINSLEPDSLNKVFIKFDENPLTLLDFLRDFSFEGFYTFTTDFNTIAAQLNSRLKRQIELELLARNAYKRGMESLPEVKSSTDIWKNNYLSTLLKKNIVVNTELTKEEISSLIKSPKKNTETEVNIIEVLTDSLEVVKEALSLTAVDSVFKQFAKQHSIRESTKEKSGEFGFFSVTENNEIGKIAENMEVGDVYGPLKTEDGYSVFKLIDKRVKNIDLSKIDEKGKLNLRYNKVMNKLEDKAVELAEKYKVTVNEQLLNSLELLNAQMVVFRYMGFGGRISAYPYSSPFYKWKEKWEQKKKEVL